MKIKGKDRVEGVTVAKVDEKMRPIPGTEFDIECDTLLLSVGLIPENELSIGAGVELAPLTNGPKVDQHRQTNLPGIYAAGDCCESIDSQSGTNMNIGVWANAQQQGAVAGVNAAGGNQAFDANILINLAHFLDYDFLAYGNIRLCSPDDDWYEYEDEKYYIKACRGQDGSIKCVNITGSADINAVSHS